MTDDAEMWSSLLEKMRPKSLEEWFRKEAPRVEVSIGVDKSVPKSVVGEAGPSILQSLGLSREEFVELALSQPDLWDEDEKYYMESVLDGADPTQLEQLATQYFSGARRPKRKEEKPPAPPPPPPELDTQLVPPDLPNRISSIPDLPVLEGTMDVGKWWEKK